MAASSLIVRRFLSSSSSSSALLRRPVASFNANPIPPLLRPVAAYRSFNTNAPENDQPRKVDDTGSLYYNVKDPRFSHSFNMGSPTSIWSQVYNMGRQLFKLLEEQCFSVRETEDSLRIRLFMFGLDKEDLNITVDHNTLTIKGVKESEEGCRQVLSSTYDLTGKPYKIDQIKAKIKNGCVLKIVVPKMKEDVKINVKIQDCREEEE